MRSPIKEIIVSFTTRVSIYCQPTVGGHLTCWRTNKCPAFRRHSGYTRRHRHILRCFLTGNSLFKAVLAEMFFLHVTFLYFKEVLAFFYCKNLPKCCSPSGRILTLAEIFCYHNKPPVTTNTSRSFPSLLISQMGIFSLRKGAALA